MRADSTLARRPGQARATRVCRAPNPTASKVLCMAHTYLNPASTSGIGDPNISMVSLLAQ